MSRAERQCPGENIYCTVLKVFAKLSTLTLSISLSY